jgi:CheY-like chemotaxis protein
MLAVSDNGCGMDRQTLDNLFEPFFTTKGVGEGTGLGLATVYGIVKQNEGFINVYSEPGRGTTFKIYLRKHTGPLMEDQPPRVASLPEGRGEMVIIVEDEPATLRLIKRMLTDLGYKVLVAENPSEVIQLAAAHAGAIALLITDVVMPGMNGRELAERLQTLYPDIKTLFMSGYTANVIAHHGVLDAGVQFIQKPFSKRDLATKVRQALGLE